MIATPAAPPTTDPLTRALEAALASPSPEGDVRALAFGDLTCVIRWTPASGGPTAGSGPTFYRIELRLRRPGEARDQEASLNDLTLLSRWCEHHVRYFCTQSRSPAAAPRPAGEARMSATDRLRARLQVGQPLTGTRS